MLSVLLSDVEEEIDASTSTLQITNSALGEDFLDYGEKVINPGNILHLPTIKLIKSYHEPKTFVVARVNRLETVPLLSRHQCNILCF